MKRRRTQRYTFADNFCFYFPRLLAGLLIGTALLYQLHPAFNQYINHQIQKTNNDSSIP